MKFLYLLTLCTLAGQLCGEVVWQGKGAQDTSVLIELSNVPVDVDKKVQIRVTLQAPKGYQVDKSKIRNQLLNFIGFGPSPFTLLSEETTLIDAQTTKITYTLDPEMTGNHQLTLGNVIFEPPSQSKEKPLEIMTGVFNVPVILKTDQIAYQGLPAALLPLSMKLPVDISSKNYEDFVENDQILAHLLEESRELLPKRGRTVMVLVACLLIGLMLLLGRYWRQAMQPSQAEMQKKLTQSAAERAVNALQSLKNKHYAETASYDAYYSTLTAIVRQFLEEAYNIHALKLTTIEFLRDAATNPLLETDFRELLKQFLTNADRVKFAQGTSTSEECETSFQQALEIVRK